MAMDALAAGQATLNSTALLADAMNNFLLGGMLVVIVVAFIAFLVFASFFTMWIQAYFAGARITFGDLIGMWFRRVSSRVIVKSKIMAVQAGVRVDEMTTKALEAHYLAGGNVPLVVRALIAASKAKTIALTYREATAIDLAGRDILESVQTSVYPKVIDCPAKDSGKMALDSVARNGIQLKVKARVTVRANLQQLIGGATEETIVARVGEGIVSAIGSAPSHEAVLENPDMISKTVLSRRLDSETAFEIVSIDIADIDVGDNIGARLQADRAEADTRIARARAEGRRAKAVALDQEMVAKIQESRASLVNAEAEVPKAMADAFRSGKLSIMDYYRLRNIQADTEMRNSIATAGDGGKA
jgi:uncharacterized protein YqfA (UPF0365 family)